MFQKKRQKIRSDVLNCGFFYYAFCFYYFHFYFHFYCFHFYCFIFACWFYSNLLIFGYNFFSSFLFKYYCLRIFHFPKLDLTDLTGMTDLSNWVSNWVSDWARLLFIIYYMGIFNFSTFWFQFKQLGCFFYMCWRILKGLFIRVVRAFKKRAIIHIFICLFVYLFIYVIAIVYCVLYFSKGKGVFFLFTHIQIKSTQKNADQPISQLKSMTIGVHIW